MRTYDRQSSRNQSRIDWEDEQDSLYWCDYFIRDDMWEGPSMEDVMLGRLFTMLTKLQIRSAKVQLEYLYW